VYKRKVREKYQSRQWSIVKNDIVIAGRKEWSTIKAGKVP